MSFNSKNLAYDAKEPAFLQRLKNQYGDTSGRLERPIARPRLAKNNNDDDDEPTYVDEESNEVISKEDYEALVRDSNKETEGSMKDASGQGQSNREEDKGSAEKEASLPKQNIAEIGGPKKRKQAKLIGEEDPPPEREEKSSNDTGSRKPKQKKKKIKLSFDQD
ncbi:hypothetical protein BDV25DRAFT_146761 [Aspergillus avenaceus]|uniref:DUF4604 domain-containing protein n=1 Tax=Aspergillus avenaceus TaxID=36643 RepID=A0A5N6U8K5_ASPAV|nr:hypothetical protein BDV25DRAFT_146761 [Aspergillus avenaceus]